MRTPTKNTWKEEEGERRNRTVITGFAIQYITIMLSHQTILFGLGKEKHLHIKNTLYLSSNFLKLSSITLLWLIIDKTVVGHLGNVSMHACFRYSFLCTMIHKRDSTSAFMLMFSSIKEAIIFSQMAKRMGMKRDTKRDTVSQFIMLLRSQKNPWV